MYRNNSLPDFSRLLSRRPDAAAELRGSRIYPEIRGIVRFYETPVGVVVSTAVSGLPVSDDLCKSPVFAFHIHEGGRCTGNDADPFANTLLHYNPHGCMHPYHAGDLPPLFGAEGYAYSVFLTDRFTVREILGRTAVIHAMPDDFMTQPAGNAGMKIACGEIRR